MEKVSIIVPIYNAKKYLRRGIESLLLQTYKDIEIILIDDGSNDGCYNICEEYVKSDSRVKCFHRENGGLSLARNEGIVLATSPYIMFMDADDYYENDAVETMIKHINNNIQLVVAKYNVVKGNNKEEVIGSDEEGVHSCKNYMKMAFDSKTDFYFGVVWNKIYLRDVILKNNILFKNEVTLCEDLLFNLSYLKHIENVYVLNHIVNNYEQDNPVSLVKKERPRGYNWYCKSYVHEAYIEVYSKKGLYEKYKKNIANEIMVAIVQELKEIIDYEGREYSSRKLRRIIKSFCEDDKVSLAARDCDIEKKLEKLTANLIKRKSYRELMYVYELKRFIKNNIGCIHNYMKKKNMEKK